MRVRSILNICLLSITLCANDIHDIPVSFKLLQFICKERQTKNI